MDQNDIMEIIPHRGSMLLLDMIQITKGVARGERLISIDDWFLNGHFPGNPIVPGVILCEIMAQTCGVLIGSLHRRGLTVITCIDRTMFFKEVSANDRFIAECRITNTRGDFYWGTCKGFVDDELCVESEQTFKVLS